MQNPMKLLRLKRSFSTAPDTVKYLPRQTTIKGAVVVKGQTLHHGGYSRVTINPAGPDEGIKIRAFASDPYVKLSHELVTSTALCTTITVNNKIVSTVEHLLGVLNASGIDNALLDVSGMEIPIGDGSGEHILRAIAQMGTIRQKANRKFLKVNKTIQVSEGDRTVSLEPNPCFQASITVKFDSEAIGTQTFEFDERKQFLYKEVVPARTFVLEKDVNYLKQKGLIKGGNLENALVFNEKQLINNTKLRFPDEVVRHKLFDVVGDLFLVGYRIMGFYRGTQPGHTLNHKLLVELMSNKENYTIE